MNYVYFQVRTVSFREGIVGIDIPSRSLTARPWKVTETQKGKDRLPTSNHHFSGAMLNFGGVYYPPEV